MQLSSKICILAFFCKNPSWEIIIRKILECGIKRYLLWLLCTTCFNLFLTISVSSKPSRFWFFRKLEMLAFKRFHLKNGNFHLKCIRWSVLSWSSSVLSYGLYTLVYSPIRTSPIFNLDGIFPKYQNIQL